MKRISVLALLALTSCNGMWNTLDDAVSSKPIKVELQKEAIQEDTNVYIEIELINRQPKAE